MTEMVLDASAVLAFLNQEPGQEHVRPWVRGGVISAVNACEVINRRFRPGSSLADTVAIFHSLEMRVIDFDMEQAIAAASLEPYARAANLSFGDRACLSLGILRNLPVLTAEHGWATLPFSMDIRLIRDKRARE